MNYRLYAFPLVCAVIEDTMLLDINNLVINNIDKSMNISIFFNNLADLDRVINSTVEFLSPSLSNIKMDKVRHCIFVNNIRIHFYVIVDNATDKYRFGGFQTHFLYLPSNLGAETTMFLMGRVRRYGSENFNIRGTSMADELRLAYNVAPLSIEE